MPTSSVGRTGSRRARNAGLTLLEMIVVTAIIALMAGLSYPAISAGLDSVRLATATESVASFLNSGVTHAQRRQQGVALIISPRDSRLALYSNEPGYTRELKVPDGIVIEGILPETSEAPGEPRHFLFLPGGTVPGITVILANKRGGQRQVRLDPMTGFPRIESVIAK